MNHQGGFIEGISFFIWYWLKTHKIIVEFLPYGLSPISRHI